MKYIFLLFLLICTVSFGSWVTSGGAVGGGGPDVTSLSHDGVTRKPTADMDWNGFRLFNASQIAASSFVISGNWNVDSSGTMSYLSAPHMDISVNRIGLRKHMAPTNATFNIDLGRHPTSGVIPFQNLYIESVITKKTDTNLTADDTVIDPINKTFLLMSSDDGTASNRTFTISTTSVEDGHRITLCWSGANAGELLDAGNHKLSAAWTPTDDDCLELIFDGTDWLETNRSTN
jgi:hypothetical protein